jgi:hypothetical protein
MQPLVFPNSSRDVSIYFMIDIFLAFGVPNGYIADIADNIGWKTSYIQSKIETEFITKLILFEESKR